MARALASWSLALAIAGCASPPPRDPFVKTNYAEAKLAAAALDRPILMDFTGSDWCVFCKKLHREVFDTPEFLAWAQKKVVLLELDYPRVP